MQDLIRPDASFTPRELFARMQGAWFEPRQGYMWQENTGATPTTRGGQTIGKLVDLSADRVASQATAANRPLFGARLNLLTYSEQFDNAAWGKSRLNSVTISDVGPFGYGNFYALVEDGTAGKHETYQSMSAIAQTYTISAYAKKGIRDYLHIGFALGGQENGGYFNLTNGTISKTSAGYTTSITALSGGVYRCIVTFTVTTPETRYIILCASDNGTSASYNGSSGSIGIYIYGAQLELGSVATDYQRVTTATDYDAGRFPAIRHADSTDVLAAAMPAINVRRNLVTYSEQFDNASWVKQQASVTPNAAIAPDGTATADLLYEQANIANHNIYHTSSVAGGAASTLSVRAKESTRRYMVLNVSASSTDWAIAAFDLRTGAVTQQSSGATGSVISAYSVADRNGYFRCVLTATTAGANRSAAVLISNAGTFGVQSYGVVSYLGDGASGIHIWGAQHELGSAATDYQKITDWTSEAYSSAGSVYFSTPVGMSCLHNQSIGTSYNLPAPQTDNYCTVITPARLVPPLEQRLALYMHRLAGLADADFFWQEQATDGMTGQLLADDNDTILLRA